MKINRTPEQAYCHCVRNGRNEKLEKIILTDPEYAYLYAQDIIKGRWIEAENIISTDPEWACEYALYVIKGRWTEAENTISTNSEWAYYYAQSIIKGKLPENMHNAMLLHADEYAKEYVKFINKLTPSV